MKNMLKWIPVLAIAAVAAQAQPDFPAEPPEGEAPPQDAVMQDGLPPPEAPDACPEMGGRMPPPPPPHKYGFRGHPGMPPCGNPGLPPPDCKGPTEEQKAEFAAFRKLCKDVRAETDEAKKAELVESLRGKLGEMADHQRDAQKARLAAAEKRIEEQKARLDQQVEVLRAMIDEAEANRDEWIESQLQCILSGERPPMRHKRPGKGCRPECGGPAACPGAPEDGRCGDRPFPPCRKKCGPKDCPRGFHKPPCAAPQEDDVPPSPSPEEDAAE